MCSFLWLNPTRTPLYTSTWAQSLCPQLPLLSWTIHDHTFISSLCKHSQEVPSPGSLPLLSSGPLRSPRRGSMTGQLL